MKRCRPPRLRAPILFFLCSIFACSDEAPWAGTVQIEDGVEVISNPGEPLLGEVQPPVSELWQVQEADWVDPSRVHAWSGLVTVTDPRASRIHVLTPSGQTQTSLGRPGGGPGEFLRLLDAFLLDDRLLVLDAGKGGAEYLDLDGTYLSTLHLDGQPWGGFLLDDGTLLAKGEFLSDPLEETLGDWVTIEDGGEPSAFASRPLEALPEEQGVQCSDLSAWGAGAARLRFTTPRIEVFDRRGALVLESRIDLPVEDVSDAERDAALSRLRQTLEGRRLPPQFVEQNLIVMNERWRVKCRFGPLRFDAARGYAAFLEQNPDDFGSGSATLHFVSGEGVYLARVAFPDPWRDFALADGVVYALTRDPTTDLVTLEAARVELPSSVFAEAAEALDAARRRAVQEGRPGAGD
jgi:hypothetical protein